MLVRFFVVRVCVSSSSGSGSVSRLRYQRTLPSPSRCATQSVTHSPSVVGTAVVVAPPSPECRPEASTVS